MDGTVIKVRVWVLLVRHFIALRNSGKSLIYQQTAVLDDHLIISPCYLGFRDWLFLLLFRFFKHWTDQILPSAINGEHNAGKLLRILMTKKTS